jgi:protein CLEC16A
MLCYVVKRRVKAVTQFSQTASWPACSRPGGAASRKSSSHWTISSAPAYRHLSFFAFFLIFFIPDLLRYLHNQLTKNPIIHDGNKELITEVLRSVAELMIWGDQHNSAFFDYFCEKNMLGFFPKIMHQRTSARVKVQLIQTLSIMIQNISSEHAIFYFLSNNVRCINSFSNSIVMFLSLIPFHSI